MIFQQTKIQRGGRAITTSLAAFFFALLAGGCSGGDSELPAPNEPGARVWAEHCGACHNRPHPGRHSLEEWRPILKRMQFRMKQRKRPVLTADETAAILAYLSKYAR